MKPLRTEYAELDEERSYVDVDEWPRKIKGRSPIAGKRSEVPSSSLGGATKKKKRKPRKSK